MEIKNHDKVKKSILFIISIYDSRYPQSENWKISYFIPVLLFVEIHKRGFFIFNTY